MSYRHNYKKLPVVLTLDELNRLLNRPNPRFPTGLRNRCILRVMANAGLRCAEALALRVKDVNWMSGQLDVRNGKGGFDRTLWLNEDDLEMLRKWRAIRPAGKCEELFTTLHGTPVQGRYVREMVKRLARKAGIEKDVHPHVLRHTFATDLYRKTKNIRLVQKALGP
jgi:site-specific recombinase XerD